MLSGIMGNKVSEEQIAVVRSVLGDDLATEMDIIRALHLANNDAAAAINIILDTPLPRRKKKTPNSASPSISNSTSPPPPAAAAAVPNAPNPTTPKPKPSKPAAVAAMPTSNKQLHLQPCPCPCPSDDSDWWLTGSSEVAGMSTCKGRRIKPGDKLTFSFPIPPPPQPMNSPSSTNKFPAARGRSSSVASCSDIVRFSTQENGEIGRIPNEWARCLSPLVRANKIRVDGYCKSAPQVLGIMDTVLLSISIYINSLMFRKHHSTFINPTTPATEASTVHPLPTLFRLLGLDPFKQADFSPENIYTRKRSIESKDSSEVPGVVLPPEKCRKLSLSESKEIHVDKSVPDYEVENIVGLADSSQLEEMIPPETLQCELRPYQKQALNWMVQVEKGGCLEESATTLHPCWNAYRLADKREPVVYLNAFSGDATTEFPSTLQMARGGILADAMGLGKTIMTIALLLTHSGNGSSSTSSDSQTSAVTNDANHILDQSSNVSKKSKCISDFNKSLKFKAPLIGGGNLIICPMTLLGQWKAEIETHAQPGCLTVYAHYGQSRPRDAKFLSQNDVVLTTYGVLASEFSAENSEDNGGLYSVQWFRIVLDEAHTIKSSKSQISIATAALAADRRWCLTGTPIQGTFQCWGQVGRLLKGMMVSMLMVEAYMHICSRA